MTVFAQGSLTSGVPTSCMHHNVCQIAHFWRSKTTVVEKLVDKTFTVRMCLHTEKHRRNVEKTKLVLYKCSNVWRNVEKTKLIPYKRIYFFFGKMNIV